MWILSIRSTPDRNAMSPTRTSDVRNLGVLLKKGILISALLGSLGVTSKPGWAGSPDLTQSCEALKGVDLSQLQDAPTQILDTKLETTAGRANCKVRAYVSPQVGVEMWLPLTNWNGKLISSGNVGWGGRSSAAACAINVARGYACVTTDTGHQGGGEDALWALGNLPAQLDFAYRAVHVTSIVGKAVVNRFYSQPPRKSYFEGCSTGGYQGLIEAERFPWDFDGILAGSPDMDEADLTMRDIWARKSFLGPQGQPSLDAKALQTLHQAVLAQCDLDDGVKDGIVGNPIGCAFKPERLLCSPHQSRNCLTAAQVQAAQRIYNGPPHSARPIRGALPGSEYLWGNSYFGYEAGSNVYFDNFFKYMVYGASPGWDSASFDFERDYQRLGLAAAYSATNPDLRAFKAAGGKLMVFQGGDDLAEMPAAVVDYYQTVESVLGGAESTQDFFRLFIIPGVNHCGAGVGAYAIDYLSYLEAWVERSRSPDELLAAHVSDEYLASLPLPPEIASHLPPDAPQYIRALAAMGQLHFPLDPSVPLAFTRPVYPYPKFARYKGRGDPNSALSFIPVSETNSKRAK